MSVMTEVEAKTILHCFELRVSARLWKASKRSDRVDSRDSRLWSLFAFISSELSDEAKLIIAEEMKTAFMTSDEISAVRASANAAALAQV